jgi:hypothetical protein
MLVYRYILAQEQIVMKKRKKIITSLEVHCIVKKYKIRIGPFTIRQDGYIDVSGNVKFCYTNAQKLPLRFGNVYGDFLCHSNKLTTLKGCPTYVAGDFNCYNNNLTSLRYCPAEVGNDFLCHENNLKDLEGCPKEIKGNFNVFANQITTLKDAPERIEGSCFLNNNELTSLLGGPKYISGSYNVSANPLNDMVGCAEFIGDTLSYDHDVRMFMGSQNCTVKTVVIQIQEVISDAEYCLSKVVIDNQKHLPILFKYISYLDLYTQDGVFIESNFDDIILEIKEGLR